MKAHQVGMVLLMAILSVKATTYYSCNFDKDDCSVKFTEDNAQFLKISSFLQDRDYYFTDSTSINSAAANGKKCKIPFNVGSTQYYHCTAAGQCDTSSGLSKCATGRFMNGLANDSLAGSYIARARFLPFEVPDKGNYTLNYKAFMFCDGDSADCEKINEILDVFVNEATTDDNYVTYQLFLRDFGGSKSWKQLKETIRLDKGKYYIEFVLGRFSFAKPTVYYGVDDIEVVRSKASWTSVNLMTMLIAFVASVLFGRAF